MLSEYVSNSSALLGFTAVHKLLGSETVVEVGGSHVVVRFDSDGSTVGFQRDQEQFTFCTLVSAPARRRTAHVGCTLLQLRCLALGRSLPLWLPRLTLGCTFRIFPMLAANSGERLLEVRIEARNISKRGVENGFHGASQNLVGSSRTSADSPLKTVYKHKSESPDGDHSRIPRCRQCGGAPFAG